MHFSSIVIQAFGTLESVPKTNQYSSNVNIPCSKKRHAKSGPNRHPYHNTAPGSASLLALKNGITLFIFKCAFSF